jgi:hypothetical protein
MVNELHRTATISRGLESRSGAAPAELTLIHSLQSLRQRVLERLDSLEALARQRLTSATAMGETAAREQALELKLVELEETERRLAARTERQEKEWSESLTQLEVERRLLAEAWERLERERIVYSTASEPHHSAHPGGLGSQKGAAAALARAAPLITAQRAGADPDANHPITQAILRQFQTLCSDVRRNSEGRREIRPERGRTAW